MNQTRLFIVLTTLFLGISLTSNVSAQQQIDRQLGAGVIVGEPTGISLKYWNNDSNAFDAGISWSITNEFLHLHADYLMHKYGLFDIEKGNLPLYYGLGGRMLFADDPDIGVRIPVGLNYLMENDPIGFFIEIAPTLDLIPDVEFDMGGGIGVRYYF